MAESELPISPDFPESVRLSIHSKVEAKYGVTAMDVWQEFNAGLGGLLYRFTACTGHDEAFTDIFIANGSTPSQPERYYQERELFEFFITGQSAIECLSYALYALGEMAKPTNFDCLAKGKAHKISPESTRDAYQLAFNGQRLTNQLASVVNSKEYEEWTALRNVLIHRAHPGRVISIGGSGPPTRWMGLTIDSRTTRSRRDWLAEQIAKLLGETNAFVDSLP